MAVVTGMGFSLDDALKEAEKLDKHFDTWLNKSVQLEAQMKKAFNTPSNMGSGIIAGLESMRSLIEGLKSSTINPKGDTGDIDKINSALDKVVERVNIIKGVSGDGFQFFDPKGLYASEKSLGELLNDADALSARIQKNLEAINASRKELKDANGLNDDDPAKKEAIAKAKKKLESDEIAYAKLLEEKKKLVREIAFAQMTAGEQEEHIAKKVKKLLAEEQAEIQKIRGEYKHLQQELQSTVTSRTAFEDASKGRSMNASDKEIYDATVQREADLRAQIAQMENDHLEYISDLRISYAIKDAKNVAAEMKKRQYSPTEALGLASNARTGDEMEFAKEAVQSALMNVDKDDVKTIKELNNAYVNLRAGIEKLTKAQKNEQTLQPTVRNEYRRTLNELDALTASMEKFRATDAYDKGGKEDSADMKAMIARYNDLEARKLQLKEQSEGLLDEVEREHAAKRAQERVKEYEQSQKELEGFRAKYGEITSFKAQEVIDSSNDAKNVRQSQKAIEDLKEARAKLSKEDANYDDTLERLNAEIKRHEEYIESVTNAEKHREQQQKRARETYQGAMDYSMQAKSVTDINNAIKALDAARKKEDLTTKQGKKNYKELTRELERQQKQYNKLTNNVKTASKGLIDTAGQLKRALGLAFSVSQIRGYVHQIMQVRGEFELQHRSLQVLIQDADKANEIWDKTIALAVKSPFRVKELVTYTKQLSAYKVEADKLYETNKMLADVSAGLGVDMNRLILAFGQVKAANYLRGTELRQFSEAGINVLDELAKKFSEVQGRAVSAGDVFEMVSKRMVSFEDVQEVFEKVTSEGGMFYQMQEKQAETLQGVMRNLQDSLDLMMNDMGISMGDTLKNAISLAKNLVEEWRKLVPIVSAIGVAMATKLSAQAIKGIYNGLQSLVVAFKNLGKASLAASGANPWILLASVIAGLIAAIISARKEMNKFQAAMIQVEGNIKKQLSESIELYKSLADTAKDATKTEIERDKAMKSLKERFSDILPDSLLEAEYVLQLSDNYEKANRAMMAYYDAKAREQKKDKVDAMFDAELYEKALPKVQKGVREFLEESKNLTEQQRTILLSYSNSLLGQLVNEAKEGTIEAENIYKEFISRISTFAEMEGDEAFAFSTEAWRKYLDVDFKPITKVLAQQQDMLDSITGMPYSSISEKEASEWKNAEKKNLEDITAIYKKLLNYYSQFASASGKEREKIAASIEQTMEQIPQELEAYVPHLKSSVAELRKVAEDNAFEFGASMQNLESKFIGGLNDVVLASYGSTLMSTEKGEEYLYSLFENLEQGINDASEKVKMTGFQEAIVSGMREISEKTKVSVTEFTKYIPKMGETLTDVKNRVSGDIESFKARVEDFTTSMSSGLANTSIISPAILNEDPKQIEFFEKSLIPALELFLKLLGDADKQTTKGESLMNERIKVVDDMNKAYKDLNKTLSKSESLEGAFAKYKDAFQKAYAGTSLLPKNFGSMTAEQFIKEFNFTTEEGMVGFFDKLIAYAKKTGEQVDVELAKGDYIMETRLELKKDEDKKLLDDVQGLFDQYDLSLELKNLNIPKDLAKSLFDVDYLDLDGLKKAVQAQGAKFIGTDMEGEYEDFLERINELSRKQREDEAKEFVNFLKKNLNEIQVIQDKGAYNIALADRLFGEGKITTEQYMSSIRQIVEDTNKEVAKVNLDKFKDSATYIKAMGNLAAYSRDELEGMMSALQEQVGANAGNMGADEIRAYYEALERLVEQYDKIESPLQKGEINDLIEYLNLQKQLNQEKEKEAALEQRKAEINNRLSLLQAQLKSQQERGDVLGAASTQRQIKSAVSELKEVDGELVSVTSNISVISEKVANLGDGMIKSLVVAQKVVNEIANIANASTKMFDDIKSAADALGADTESGGWAKAGYAMEMVGGVSSELTQGLANFASGNFAGALANVVGIVTKLVSGFAKIHDQKYQNIIEAQTKRVEKLGRAYEKLETATESAYSIQQLQQYNEELERNIELQIASYKSMIAAENAKKNTDTEQIAAWNEELEALTQQWEDLKASLLEGVGGVTKDNYRSQTREFVDAWVSAYKETGDGLKGLQENFRDFFDNIIAEQAAMRVTEKFLEPFYESLNEALKDYELTADESKDLREMVEKIAPDLSGALEKIWVQLGGSGGEAGGSLSALQKGIQSVTEETAQVLEALLNSMRFYVADSNSELKNQTRILGDIYSLLNGMTDAMPAGKSGRGMKVVM